MEKRSVNPDEIHVPDPLDLSGLLKEADQESHPFWKNKRKTILSTCRTQDLLTAEAEIWVVLRLSLPKEELFHHLFGLTIRNDFQENKSVSPKVIEG